MTRAALFACTLGAAWFAGPAQAMQDCTLNGQPVNPANGHTTAGKTGLMRCIERDSGALRREQELREGQFVGLVRFYDKGRLIREYSVNDKGNTEGRAREFSPAGELLRESTYANGRNVGLARSFYAGGQLRRVSFHEAPGGERAVAEFNTRGQLSELRCADRAVLAPAVDDARLCGHAGPFAASVDLFDSQGRLHQRLSLRAGQRVGDQTFHANGQVAGQMTQADGQRTEQQFSPDGIKRRERVSRITERASIRLREAEFSERGTLVREQRWSSEGEPLAEDSYYLNGQLRRRSAYEGSGEARTLHVIEFFDNGQRAAEGRYSVSGRHGRQPIGEHQRFNTQGVLVAQSSFDNQSRMTRERAWNDAGQLQRDDEVFEDGSRKTHVK